MKYYANIQILPNPEFKDTILMNELFSKLHKVLYTDGMGKIGVSFPQVSKTLGNILRLHGTREILENILSLPWLAGLKDDVALSPVTMVPDNVKYLVVRRVQTKSSVERLMRRSIRKGWVTQDEAIEKMSDLESKKLNLPYLNVKSISSGQCFRLFIDHGLPQEIPVEGSFSAYGLSNVATVPWF